MFDRDCIKNIYASVEAEITKSEEYLKQNKEGYGDRKLAEFGKTKIRIEPFVIMKTI